ncbi:MAG: rRNA maturation RNase YbeY [Bacteroidales bacterium]|jgi:rRNA maturation RNase YbeY|nr:rRNA maturation RNase YbeY [Bacteroidales bacterium]
MIRYFQEDTDFVFKHKLLNNKWLKFVAESEVRKLGEIGIIFCSDNYILDVNMKYLQHDYFTDIITFDYCEGNTLSGDLFISVDSVRDNADFYGTEFEDELNRVIVHGLLHLIGYDDHSESEQKMMRSKEDYYLSLRPVVCSVAK